MANRFRAEKIQKAISNILTKMAVYDDIVYLVKFEERLSLRDKALGVKGKSSEVLIDLSPHFAINNSGYQDNLKDQGFTEEGNFNLVVSSSFKLPNETESYLFQRGDIFQYVGRRWQATSVNIAAMGNLILSQSIAIKRQAGEGFDPKS